MQFDKLPGVKLGHLCAVATGFEEMTSKVTTALRKHTVLPQLYILGKTIASITLVFLRYSSLPSW